MPIYEYQCEVCDHRLEKLQKVSDDPLRHCPACEKDSLIKLVSASAFRLKGSGWYETDFKNGSKKNLVDSSGTASTASAPAGKESGASDSGSSNASSASPNNSKTDKAGSTGQSGGSGNQTNKQSA